MMSQRPSQIPSGLAATPVPLGDLKEEKRRQLQAAMLARENCDVEPLRAAIEAAEAREVGLSNEVVQPAIEILHKLEEQFQPITFTDVPREEMEQLQAAQSREQAVAILMRCMRVSLDDGFLSEILAEFHYHNFTFCRRMGLCVEKASTFLSIMRAVHAKAISEAPHRTEEGGALPEAEARAFFEALVQRHSRQLPPYSAGVFSRGEAEALKAHAERTFFRLYKMHTFVYLRRQDLRVWAAEERAVPTMPSTSRFRAEHEVDPLDVPELRNLFEDPGGNLDEGGGADDPPHCGARGGPRGGAAAGGARVSGAGGAAVGGGGGGGGAGDGGGARSVPPLSLEEAAGAGAAAADGGAAAEVGATVDEALDAHLAGLEARLAALPGRG